MKEWRNLFRPIIFERGVEYYEAEKILHYKKDDNVVKAAVEGEYVYSVQILFLNDKILGAYCNCPYALKNGLCKHMVAVLLEMEKRENE